jgi:hypothetical protein
MRLQAWSGQQNLAAGMSGQNDVQPDNLEKEKPEVDGTPAHEHGYITAFLLMSMSEVA